MRDPIRLLLFSLVLSCLTGPVHAQSGGRASVEEVRDVVMELAFDPTKYFPSPYVKDFSMVRIIYTGDDYGWPVYAVAIAKGCDQSSLIPPSQRISRQRECASQLRARMVRAPAPPNMSRPRQRGSHLVSRLVEQGATSAEGIRNSLTTAGLEWVEADLRTCPGAMTALARSAEADWVPEAVATPKPGDELSGLVLHADIVQVDIQQYARLSTYRGWIADRSPGAWAVSLISTLEPCWRPAGAAPPWSSPG
jgi:hypothetical protein